MLKTITLPWIPTLSPKLRKSFRKAGYKTVYKSSLNLKTLLTSKNKSSLPKNTQPGGYKLTCSCNKSYIGETRMKLTTRLAQHQKSIHDCKWDASGITQHSLNCHGKVNWNDVETLKIKSTNFSRKVLEELEIQYHETAPKDHGLNQDDGKYVDIIIKTYILEDIFFLIHGEDFTLTSSNSLKCNLTIWRKHKSEQRELFCWEHHLTIREFSYTRSFFFRVPNRAANRPPNRAPNRAPNLAHFFGYWQIAKYNIVMKTRYQRFTNREEKRRYKRSK